MSCASCSGRGAQSAPSMSSNTQASRGYGNYNPGSTLRAINLNNKYGLQGKVVTKVDDEEHLHNIHRSAQQIKAQSDLELRRFINNDKPRAIQPDKVALRMADATNERMTESYDNVANWFELLEERFEAIGDKVDEKILQDIKSAGSRMLDGDCKLRKDNSLTCTLKDGGSFEYSSGDTGDHYLNFKQGDIDLKINQVFNICDKKTDDLDCHPAIIIKVKDGSVDRTYELPQEF